MEFDSSPEVGVSQQAFATEPTPSQHSQGILESQGILDQEMRSVESFQYRGK